MNLFLKSILLSGSIIVSSSLLAQDNFNHCAAIFLNSKILVDEYSPSGKCIIDMTAEGILSVQTVNFTSEECKPLDKIDFKLAIRDGGTNTLVSYSDQTFSEESIEKILNNCKKGDSIVILTKDARYALPHHEILIRSSL